MDLRLSGLKALVTGASRGLGYQTAQLLSSEGASVAINSRIDEKIKAAAMTIQSESGNSVLAYAADICDPCSGEKLVSQAARDLGGLDILITNSGGPTPASFESIMDDQWHSALELSFVSHLRLIRTALPFLRQSNHPSVLSITSYAAKQPIQGLVLSNAVRAATLGLIKTLSLEFGAEKIRFNAILPGWTLTDRVNTLMQSRASANRTSVEDEFGKQTAEIPLGRMASPDEFARVAVFLVSPAASYVNGVMLPVDGGISRGLL